MEATIPGATPEPFGLAVDCRGALYVAEGAGGFSRVERFGEPGTAVPPCVVDAAQPVVPISSLVKRLRVKVKLNRKRGTATLIVKVPDAGVLRLRGKDIAKAKRAAKRPSTLKVPVRSKGKTKRKLFKTGKAKVRAKLAFKSADGTRYSKSVSFTLRKQLRR